MTKTYQSSSYQSQSSRSTSDRISHNDTLVSQQRHPNPPRNIKLASSFQPRVDDNTVMIRGPSDSSVNLDAVVKPKHDNLNTPSLNTTITNSGLAFPGRTYLYNSAIDGRMYTSGAHFQFSVKALERRYTELIQPLNWGNLPESLQVLQHDPDALLKLIANKDSLEVLLGCSSLDRDHLLVTVLSNNPTLLEQIKNQCVFSSAVYFTLLNSLKITPDQVVENQLPSSIIEEARQVYRMMRSLRMSVVPEKTQLRRTHSSKDRKRNLDNVSTLNKHKKKPRLGLQVDQRHRGSSSKKHLRTDTDDNLLGIVIEISEMGNITGAANADEQSIGDDSVGYNNHFENDDLTLSSDLMEALHHEKQDEMPDLNCGGVHLKYALSPSLYAEVSRSKRALEYFEKAITSLGDISIVRSLVKSTVIQTTDQLTSIKFMKANKLATSDINFSCTKSHTLTILPENKRYYVASSQITIHYPQPRSAEQKTHSHFIMAYREASSLRLPNFEEFKDGLNHDVYFVMTQDEFERKWEGQFPKGYGAIILNNPKDIGINQRRFAALAAARQLINENRAELISLQDDNVSSVLGLEQALIGLLDKYTPKSNKHHMLTFPNRRQSNRVALTSGKLVVLHADSLRVYAPVDVELDQSSTALQRLIPPEDLFYEDIWLIRSLIDISKEYEITLCAIAHGHLNKSRKQRNTALDSFAIDQKTPLDFWADDHTKTQFFNDQDRLQFAKFKEHLMEVRRRILAFAPKIIAEAKKKAYTRSLVKALDCDFDQSNKPFVPYDYQGFFIEAFKEKISQLPVTQPTTSHVVLLMATGTGKTLTFLSMASQVMLPSIVDPKLPSKTCLIVAPRIEIARDIVNKAKQIPGIANHTRLVCSRGINTDIILNSTKLKDETLILVMVVDSLNIILNKKADFLDLFDFAVLDESHNYKEKFMSKFFESKEKDKLNSKILHRILIQASATPSSEHLDPGFYGGRQLICNFNVEAAQHSKVVRDAKFIDARKKLVFLNNKRLDRNNPEHVSQLIELILKRKTEYNNRNVRVICYVKSTKLAESCATKFNKRNSDKALGAAYHSIIPNADAVMKKFLALEETKKIKVVFAVDMLKEGTDIDGGVDFIINLSDTYLSPEKRSQVFGRAFRLSTYNNMLPAYFFDYSPPEKLTFYQERPFYKPFRYSIGDCKAKYLFCNDTTNRNYETKTLPWKGENAPALQENNSSLQALPPVESPASVTMAELKESDQRLIYQTDLKFGLNVSLGFPNFTGVSCFVASALHHLRHRVDIRLLINISEPVDLFSGEKVECQPLIKETLLQLIRDYRVLTHLQKNLLLQRLQTAIDHQHHWNYDNIRMSRQQDVSEFTSYVLEQLHLNSTDGTLILEYDGAGFRPSEQTILNMRNYSVTGTVPEVNLAIQPDSSSLERALKSHFSRKNKNNYHVNESQKYTYHQQVLFSDQLAQLAVRLKRFDATGNKLNHPIDMTKPFLMNFPVANQLVDAIDEQTPIIYVKKKVTPVLINVHKGDSVHGGHHVAYEPSYDVENKLSGLTLFDDDRAINITLSWDQQLDNILKNACMVLLKLEEPFEND